MRSFFKKKIHQVTAFIKTAHLEFRITDHKKRDGVSLNIMLRAYGRWREGEVIN